ncbi:unnamed protein product, partial [marine sediment metagenome]
SMFGLGIWLARNLGKEGIAKLVELEERVGEHDANRLLCEACENSGKYRWDRSTDHAIGTVTLTMLTY